jgi:hypothetical protein
MIQPLKFHGKFSDLIPAGFKFQKLFARNYRQYCLSLPNTDWDIRVWQHHGGYVELNDFGSFSHDVAKYILEDENPWIDGVYTGLYKKFCLDRETGTVTNFDNAKHCPIYMACHKKDDGMSEKESFEYALEITKGFSSYVITPKIHDFVKNIVDRGWIQI